jgi:hypothetical protein
MPGNMGLMNIHKYEVTFSSVNSKSETRANVDFHIKISPNLKNVHQQLTTRTANHFEVLYNLDEDGIQELGGKRLPIQFHTDNSDRRNQQPLIADFNTCESSYY